MVVWYRGFRDFMYCSGGVYTKTSDDYSGNHFVLVVGWDDASGSFICKNSWGSWWELGGYFQIRCTDLTDIIYEPELEHEQTESVRKMAFGYWTCQYGKAYGPGTEWQGAYRSVFPAERGLAAFRTYRDQILSQTLYGQTCYSTIHEHTNTLLRILLAHKSLIWRARRLFPANHAAVHGVVKRGFGVVQNTGDAAAFVDGVASCSPLDLRLFLDDLKSRMLQHQISREPLLEFILE